MRSALLLGLSIVFLDPSVSLADLTPADAAQKIEAFYKDRSDIRATFTQKVRKPGRKRVMTKAGSVFFKRPGKMRWEYKKPEVVYYISDGKVLWSYQPEDALVTRLDIQSSELYHQSRYLFGQGDLSQDFTLAAGKGAGEGQYALLLTPQKSARNFKSLTLVIDAATGEISRTELVDPYDNVSTIEFKKVQYKTMVDKHFKFTPPATATVRDLSKRSKDK